MVTAFFKANVIVIIRMAERGLYDSSRSMAVFTEYLHQQNNA